MEMTPLRQQAASMISCGVGTTHFDASIMDALAGAFQSGLPDLMPLEERPHQYLLFTAGVLKDFFKADDVLVPQSLYGFTTNFWRASNAVIETLVLHRKLPSQKTAVYLIMPGDVQDSEKAILHQAASLREDPHPRLLLRALSPLQTACGSTTDPVVRKVIGSEGLAPGGLLGGR